MSDRMDAPVWWPSAHWLEQAQLTELARRLGVADYDALLARSLADPAGYWREVIAHLQFRWRAPYESFCRLDNGPEFPRWFTGGQLNWVDSAFQHVAGPRADQPAVIAEDEAGRVATLSWSELRRSVLQLAGGLARQGVTRGTRVGLMLPMGCAAVVTFVALSALGAIAVPLFTGFGVDAAAARLDLAGASFLVASTAFKRRGREVRVDDVLAGLCARLPQLVLVTQGPTTIAGSIPWASLAHAEPIAEPRTLAPDDPFMLVFTSGTTGQPKGTVHTHAGFPLKILHDAAYHFDLRPGDRWLWTSDMGWIVGPITVIGALARGATLVCYDGAPDHPHAARLAELVDRHGVTHLGASPTLLRSLAANGQATEGARLGSLRVLITAGEVIAPEHFLWFLREFGRGELPVINYTGGTEASGALLANVPLRPIKPGSFNSVSPGVDAYVAGAAGERLATGSGELVVGAPFVGMTDGFWNAPERYLESYWTQRPGVWSHGDLVARDADGHFFVLGRADDTLKIAGKRVGPAEVEGLLLELPWVHEAAAVGLPDAVKGQALVVCLVAPHAPAQGAALVAERLEQALGKPFRPAQVHLLAQLPKTRNGKVMRRVIRNVLAGETAGDLSALDDPSAVQALRQIAGRSAPISG